MPVSTAASDPSAPADSSLERGDIAIRSLGAIKTLLDITIRATNRARGAGVGARAGELAKQNKYSHWELPDVRVVAFSLERNGMWGPEAASFIEKVGGSRAGTEEEKSAAVWRLVVRLSVALQRGNGRFAEIMTECLTRTIGLVRSPAAVV